MDPFVILKSILCFLIFNDFSRHFDELVENLLGVIFRLWSFDPDPYGHFWDPGSGSA